MAQLPYQTADGIVRPKGRELFFYGIRAYPFGKIPQHARLAALDHAETKMKRFGDGMSLLAINPWRPIGPANVGGRIRAIAVHPTDGRTLWIGAADGGVWKSTDRGESWRAVMDHANAVSMGALAIDPSNPSILYAGTGEMSSNIDAYTGAGMMKSTDGGETWTGSGLTAVGAFSKIVVFPGNGSVILAGATKNNGGLYRSTDGGASWTRTFTGNVSDVTLHGPDPSKVWIGTMNGEVWRSTDGGTTFTKSSTGIGTNTPGRVSIAVSQSNPQLVYAQVHETISADAGTSHLYRSSNGGTTWANVFNNQFNYLNSPPQGWYNNALGVSPLDDKLVLGLGVGIARSTNGGSNWSFIDAYSPGNNLHPDQHAIAFDPTDPNRVYVGNDGGVYRSDNGGASYQHKSAGLAVTQFYGLGIDQRKPNTTYGGSQDNGTMDNDGRRILGGDGAWTFVDHQSSNVIYAEREEGQMYRIEGGSVTQLYAGLDGAEDVAWSAPWGMHPTNNQIIACVRQSVYLSFNRGDSWLKTSGKFRGTGISLAFSRANPDVMYAGSNRGEVLVSTDGGGSWVDRTFAPGMPNRAVTDFAPSATDAATVYMTVSGFFTDHLFKSTDYGATWTSIGRGLPDIPFNTVALHPDDEKIIYVGSDIGVFVSIDGGESWATYNRDLPRAAVVDMEVHRTGRVLRIATHGRSMWEIDLESPSFDPGITSPSGGEVWMAGTGQTLSWNGFDGPVKLEVSSNGGGSWLPVASDVAGSNMRWMIPDMKSDYALLRATSMDGTKSATSRTFTIAPFQRGGAMGATQVRTIPYGIAFDGEHLWATDFSSDTLLKIDPETMRTVEVVEMKLTGADSLFTDIAYVPSRGNLFIHKLNNTTSSDPGGFLYEVARDGRQVGRWISPAAYPIGLAWLGDISAEFPYLVATDRNGQQDLYYYALDALNPASPNASPLGPIVRNSRVQYGPRGATQAPQGRSMYQVITDFTGDVLQKAVALKFDAETQEELCTFDLTSPATAGFINARGIELDPRDSNLWVSDYSGNIFKVASCDGTPPPAPNPASVGRGEGSHLAAGVLLAQNEPNPFTGDTRICFTLPERRDVRLSVYTLDGSEVAIIASGSHPAGETKVQLDALALGLPSGVYRYVLRIEGEVIASRSMVLLR